jgi:hypothetical protein
MIEELLKEGKIVPSHITVNLIEKAISVSKSNKILSKPNCYSYKFDIFVFYLSKLKVDGFPRNLENLHTWEEIMNVRFNNIL